MKPMRFTDRWSYQRALNWILAKPIWVLAAVAIVSYLFAAQIPRLTFSTSIYDLIIEDLPETGRYNAFKNTFGSDEIIRVVVKAENVYDPLTFSKLEALSTAAAKITGVRRVISLPTVKRAIDVTGDWEMDKFRAVVTPVQMFQRNLVSEDGKSTVLTLVLTVDHDSNSVIQAVEDLIQDSPDTISLYQIGMPLVSQALEQFTERDFFHLPPITFGLIAVILLCLFRNWIGLVLPLLSVSLCLVWTFGLMAITGVPLSILTMIVPVFLIAVGTAYCLHILTEYMHVRKKAGSSADAAKSTFSTVTFPTMLAVATTIIGLGSLLLNRIPAIREFAVFSCFGMFSLLVIALTMIPAVLVLVPLPAARGDQRHPGRKSLLDRVIDFIIDLDLNRQKITFSVFGAFALFCFVGIFMIRVETNPMGYFRADTDVSRHFHDIYQDMSGSFPINIAMSSKEEDYFGSAEHIAQIAKVQKFLDTLPGIDKTISFADYLQLIKYASNSFDPEYYAPPKADWESRMLINKFRMMLGEDMFDRFMTPEMNRTNIVLFTHLTSSSDFLSTKRKILEYVNAQFSRDLTWDVTGFGVVISASSHLLTSGQIKSLSLTMVLVFAIMFTLFLSRKVGLVALVPNMFPILVNFGLMGWLGIELSMFTSLIASIAIGLAVDDTIHYMVRYNREFKKDLNDKRALKETIRQIGRPIIFTTITISIGFSVLAFSSFKATAIFGAMMVVTMLSALVGDLILLPSLMMHVELVTLWDLVRLKMGKEPGLGIPLFNGLTRTQVHYIIMAGAIREISAGDVLFRKGDSSDSMYALISGEMEVLDHDIDWDPDCSGGIRKVINRLNKGDVVGEMGLLRAAPRSATIIATTACELLQINLKMINRLQWLYPPAARRFFLNLMTILCDRVEHTSHCLLESSLFDDLTGLCNQKSFLSNLETETHRSHRYQSDLSLCLMRLERDSRGGSMFDSFRISESAYTSFSRLLEDHLRKSDVLGRLDDSLFALMMPHTSMGKAEQICFRLMQLVQSDWPEVSNGLRVRFGLASLNTRDAEKGLDLMDRAMHDLKKAASAPGDGTP